MENNEMNLNAWVDSFNNGEFEANDTDTQCNAGWYDWFCKDSSLAGKTKKLASKLKTIMKMNEKSGFKHFNPETSFVFFKNNCPFNGTLYDDFRICDRESGDVIFTITPSCGHASNAGMAEVYGKPNDFKEALVSGGWNDVKEYFSK